MRWLRAVFMMVAVAMVATSISLVSPRPALASDFTVTGVVSCTDELPPNAPPGLPANPGNGSNPAHGSNTGNANNPVNGSGSGGQPVGATGTAVVPGEGASTGVTASSGGTEELAAPTSSTTVSTVDDGLPATASASVAPRGGVLWYTISGLLVLVALALAATYVIRRRRSKPSLTPDVAPAPAGPGEDEGPLDQAR